MGREYFVPFEQIAVTAAQDLIVVVGASLKMLRIKQVQLAPTDQTLAAAQMLAVRARVLGPTITQTGGTGVTPGLYDPGDAAATFTAKRNCTTKTTTSGSAQIVYEDTTHLYAPLSFMFPDFPIIPPTSAFVFELLNAPTVSITLSGGVRVEEIG